MLEEIGSSIFLLKTILILLLIPKRIFFYIHCLPENRKNNSLVFSHRLKRLLSSIAGIMAAVALRIPCISKGLYTNYG